MSTTPVLYDIDQAVAIRLNHLDQQARERDHAEAIEKADAVVRCTAIMAALTEHVMRREGVIVPMGLWQVTEDGYPAYRSYIASIEFGNPTACAEEDYSNMRQISLRDLTFDQLQRDALDRKWMAWHNNGYGEDFKTFVAAVTYAKTGRR